MSLPIALTGCVQIECEGGYPETFLNRAAAQQIPVWDITRRDASLWCRVAAKDYRRLRPIARRACVRMRVRSKRGLPFRLRRLGLRPGLAVGCLIACLLLQLLSSRIWVLRVEGNRSLTDEEILAVVEPLGVREGSSFAEVDVTNVRLTSLQRLPALTWLTVNQTGSIATVEVKERTEVPPVEDIFPANLVAARDGVIVSVDAVRGQATVKPGDAVRYGDLLISGVTESRVGPQLKRAAGSVIARTRHTLSVSVPLRETVTVPSHVLTRRTLVLFGWQIPLYTGGKPEGEPVVTSSRYPLTAAGVPLPIGVTVTRLCYTEGRPITRTPQQAVAIATQQLAEKEAALYRYFTAESRSLSTQTDAGSVTLSAVYTGTEEIALIRPIT